MQMTLSANCGESVFSHWKILLVPGKTIGFQFNSKTFDSLEDLIIAHSTDFPLATSENSEKTMLLRKPVSRLSLSSLATKSMLTEGKVKLIQGVKIGAKVGQGHFGAVYKGKWEGTYGKLKEFLWF
jgi:hypothetical protein